MTVTAEDLMRIESILGIAIPSDIRSALINGSGPVVGTAPSGDTAAGANAVAWGLNCTASGDQSTAGGYQCTASNQGATALGYACSAEGQGSVCIGFGSFAVPAVAVAVGDGLSALGIGSVALCEDNIATGNHSYALGDNSQARNPGEFSYASQGVNAPDAHRMNQLFASCAAANTDLLDREGNKLALEDAKVYGVTIDITCVDTVTAGNVARFRYEGLIHTHGGAIVIDDMTQKYVKNTPAYTVTITSSALLLRVQVNPGAATVNALAEVTVKALAGV